MNHLLAIDTSTNHCFVGLKVNDNYFERVEVGFKNHAKAILPLIEQLLNEANIGFAALEGMIFGQGPGSFTGLRIAACISQGLAVAYQLPIWGVSSLALQAQAAHRTLALNAVWVLQDARMNEVYSGHYQAQANKMVLQSQERVGSLTDVGLVTDDVVVGNGFEQQRSNSTGVANVKDLGYCQFNMADFCCLIVDEQPSSNAHPTYIKNNVTYR